MQKTMQMHTVHTGKCCNKEICSRFKSVVLKWKVWSKILPQCG